MDVAFLMLAARGAREPCAAGERVAAGTPSDQSPTDLALGRVLGLVILLPVINALLHPSAARRLSCLGLVALALHRSCFWTGRGLHRRDPGDGDCNAPGGVRRIGR